MDRQIWNNIRSYILGEALYEMNVHLTENKRTALYDILKYHFKINNSELATLEKQKSYYLNYDIPLFNEICNFISKEDNAKFNYNIKPRLRKKELNAISAALDTIITTIFHCKSLIPKFIVNLKFNISMELSNNYNIANVEFIEWYEDLFNDLDKRIKEEVSPKKYIDFDIIKNIKSEADNVDYELFTKLIFYIRSQLTDNLNYSLL